MYVYWLLLAGSLIIGYPLCKIKYGREIYCSVFGLVLFFVSAVRQSVGWDYNSYANIYIGYQDLETEDLLTNRIEKGYALLTKYLGDVFEDYHVLFYVTSFILVGLIMLYIYKKSEKPYLSVFFFLASGMYFNSMDFLRQMMAAVVLLYAMQYIEKKQFIRFIVFTLLAATFHMSALIMLVFYFILRIKVNWVSLGVYAAFTAVFFLFSWQILGFITDYVYTSYDPITAVEMTTGTKPIYTVYFGIFFLLAFIFRKDLVAKNPENNTLINCMFFTFFFELCGTRHAIISRFAILFFIPAFLVLVPRIITVLGEKCQKIFKGRKKQIIISQAVVAVLFVSICSGMYGYMIANNYNGVTPYRTIFEEVGTNE